MVENMSPIHSLINLENCFAIGNTRPNKYTLFMTFSTSTKNSPEMNSPREVKAVTSARIDDNVLKGRTVIWERG